MAKKYKYKNISDQELVIMNVGVVKPGEEIEVDYPIENPNLQLVTGKSMVGIDPVTQAPNRQ